MLIPRRRILQSAIAAPFIIGIKKSLAFPLRGGTSLLDLTAQVLSLLANNTWSSDQIASGNHVSDLQFGGNLGLGTNGVGDVWAYSSGCYLGGQKKYMLPGTGGHNDSCNTGIATLNLASLSWAVTELSANYNVEGSGVADPSNPTTNTSTFKNWPNANGLRAPSSGHRYSIPVWMSEIGFGFSMGLHCYNTGADTQGYYLFNSSGQHDQSHGYSTSFLQNDPGDDVISTTLWVPGRKVLWGIDDNNSTTSEINPIGGTPTSPCTFNDAALPDLGGQHPFVLIPDPNNSGDQAVVCWSYNFFVGSEKIVYFPKVGSGATGQSASTIAFGGTVPAALSVSNAAFTYHMSTFFDFAGNYKSGSTKILVWDWGGGTGLYLLDTSTWTFTGPLTGSAIPFTMAGFAQNNFGFRSIFVMTDYVVSGQYVPIGIVQPGSSGTTGQLYFYKIPWSSL